MKKKSKEICFSWDGETIGAFPPEALKGVSDYQIVTTTPRENIHKGFGFVELYRIRKARILVADFSHGPGEQQRDPKAMLIHLTLPLTKVTLKGNAMLFLGNLGYVALLEPRSRIRVTQVIPEQDVEIILELSFEAILKKIKK